MVNEFLCIILLIDVFFCFVGVVILSIVREIFGWIHSRILRACILFGVMGVGFVYLVRSDTPMLLSGALAFVAPVAVLVPPYLTNGRPGRDPGYYRLLLCDLLVSVVGAVLPFLLVSSGLSMVPLVYWHTPVSNGAFYVMTFLICFAVAALVYRLMQKKT
ncbi:MAG: hypothetical protein WC342_01725 [Methanoregula sp.]